MYTLLYEIEELPEIKLDKVLECREHLSNIVNNCGSTYAELFPINTIDGIFDINYEEYSEETFDEIIFADIIAPYVYSGKLSLRNCESEYSEYIFVDGESVEVCSNYNDADSEDDSYEDDYCDMEYDKNCEEES